MRRITTAILLSFAWQVRDSNPRRLSRLIYSQIPLAARVTCHCLLSFTRCFSNSCMRANLNNTTRPLLLAPPESPIFSRVPSHNISNEHPAPAANSESCNPVSKKASQGVPVPAPHRLSGTASTIGVHAPDAQQQPPLAAHYASKPARTHDDSCLQLPARLKFPS